MVETQIHEHVIKMRAIDELRANPLNPRGPVDPDEVLDLAASIREVGLLEPLLATPDGLLIAGHRRHAAARVVGLAEVPVVERDLSAREQLECMLVENLQREDLTPSAEARAYRSMLDDGASRVEIARRIGVLSTRVSERLQVLDLDEAVQRLVDLRQIPLGAVKELVKIEDSIDQRRIASALARRAISATDLKAIVRNDQKASGRHVERARRRPTAPAPTARAEAVRLLAERPDAQVSLGEIRRVLELVCCECGLLDSPKLCLQCPLPKLVRAIAAEKAHASTVAE